MATPTSASALPAIGDTLSGKYTLTRVIGEGGMGVVFEATHIKIRQPVAIKILLPHVTIMPEIVTRFEREARAAGQLKSRHAVRVLDVDETPSGLPYMVMELLEGNDLSLELEQRGRVPIVDAVDWVLQACIAMDEAHANGIVHRDLKPSNLSLAREGERRVVKVLDFGISKILSDSDSGVTATSATIGTPLYMAPEQVRSAKNVDSRADIWSLGVILYELMSGEPPFNGSATAVAAAIVADDAPLLRSRVPDAPEELEQVVTRALMKKPQERFADVRELAAALMAFAPQGESLGRISTDFVKPRTTTAPRAQVVSSPSLVNAPTLLASDGTAKRKESTSATSPGWATGADETRSRTTRRRAFVGTAIAVPIMIVAALAAWKFAAAPSAPTPSTASAAAGTASASASPTATASSSAATAASATAPTSTASAAASVMSTAATAPTSPPTKATSIATSTTAPPATVTATTPPATTTAVPTAVSTNPTRL